jgi:hypothetical protein
VLRCRICDREFSDSEIPSEAVIREHHYGRLVRLDGIIHDLWKVKTRWNRSTELVATAQNADRSNNNEF